MRRLDASEVPGTTLVAERRGDFATRVAAAVVGLGFTLVALIGFVPGLSTDVSGMDLAGPDSPTEVLGLFQVSLLHNLVHLAFGAAGVLASLRLRWSRAYLLVGGALYLVIAVYGFAVPHDSAANLLPVNAAGNWLHVFLGLTMVVLGLLFWRPALSVPARLEADPATGPSERADTAE